MHLTWLIFRHRLPEGIYRGLEAIIEQPGTELRNAERYQARHFSPERKWNGEQPVAPALPGLWTPAVGGAR